MPEVVSDIILSPATVYKAPVGTALPADTVAAGTAWGGSWTKVGWTKEPVKFGYSFETLNAKIEQAIGTLRRFKTDEDLKIETVLAELTADGVLLAWDGGAVTQTAAGAGQPGKETLKLGGKVAMAEAAWGFEGAYVDEDGMTFPIRVLIYKATAEAGGDLEFGREDYVGTPLKLAAIQDMAKPVGERLFKLDKILEPASS